MARILFCTFLFFNLLISLSATENQKDFEAALLNIDRDFLQAEKVRIHIKGLKTISDKLKDKSGFQDYSPIVVRITEKLKKLYSGLQFKMEEPDDALYAIEGYGEKAARLDLNCSQGERSGKLAFRLTGGKSIDFDKGNPFKDLELSCGSSAFFNLAKVSMIPSRNVIKILPGGIYFQLIEFLENELGFKKSDIVVGELALKKTPIYYQSSYKEHEKILIFSPVFGMVKGRQIEAVMTEKGNFTIGAIVNEVPMDLIYGHPNGSGQDGLWTSNLSVKVGEKVYKFSSLQKIQTNANSGSNEISVTGEVPDKAILVKISLRAITGETEKIRVSISAENKSASEESIGFRLFLDTWAGENDGVPFTIPGAYGNENFIHQNEVRFNPITSSVWETLDSNDTGFSLIRNTLIGGELTPPDELAFVNWGEAFNTEWDYKVDKDIPLTGDSSVLNWWNPRPVKPNGRLDISTDYSTFQRKKGIYFQMEDSKNGFGYVYIQYPNSSEKKDVSYSLDLENGKIQNYYSSENKLKFQVNPKDVLNRIIPVTLIGNGKTVLKVKENIDGAEKVFKFEVSLPEMERGITSPVWSSEKKYPIQYISEQKGLKLKGRLKDKKNGNALGEVDLVPSASGLNQIYYGEVSLGQEFSGEVDVEILDMAQEP